MSDPLERRLREGLKQAAAFDPRTAQARARFERLTARRRRRSKIRTAAVAAVGATLVLAMVGGVGFTKGLGGRFGFGDGAGDWSIGVTGDQGPGRSGDKAANNPAAPSGNDEASNKRAVEATSPAKAGGEVGSAGGSAASGAPGAAGSAPHGESGQAGSDSKGATGSAGTSGSGSSGSPGQNTCPAGNRTPSPKPDESGEGGAAEAPESVAKPSPTAGDASGCGPTAAGSPERKS